MPLFTLTRLIIIEVNWASGEATPAGLSTTGIPFDRFMRAIVTVKQIKEWLEALDRDPYGRVKVDFDSLLRMIFKLP